MSRVRFAVVVLTAVMLEAAGIVRALDCEAVSSGACSPPYRAVSKPSAEQ